MRYIFAHALRGRGSRARCRPQAGKKGKAEGKPGNGIVAERRGRICGGRRSPQAQGAACAVPPAGCWRCVFPACGRHERSAGRRTARQRGRTGGASEPGARRNPRRGKRGREARRDSPGGASAEKRRRNIPRREESAQAEQQSPHLPQKARAFLSPWGRGRP